jgi:hypothetical protein
MQIETINIEPKLSKSHLAEFTTFCKRIKKRIHGKKYEERLAILNGEKDAVNKQYSGKSFHSNTDLAFIENLIIDLLLQDWNLVITKEQVKLELEVLEEKDKNLDEEKLKTRRRHLLARDAQLNIPSVREFIKAMEKRKLTNTGWHSIFSVMRDGTELSNALKEASSLQTDTEKETLLERIVQPYIQFVEPGLRCEKTGLLLSDVWRYFRHTWVSEYKSLPGRTISILIRDAAIPNHPVIGIAALGSSVAQQTCRDRWIGWEGDIFLEQIMKDPTGKYGKWVISNLTEMLQEIYLKDFYRENIISRRDLRKPTKEKITELRNLALKYKQKHINNPEAAKFISTNDNLSWKQRAESFLFKSKRALLLAELLSIKEIFNKHQFVAGTKKELERCLEKKDFCDAVQKLVRKAKSIHVGINMMDIIVCGSVAPYNHLLGGKLVCMMLTSPEISQYYNKKYKDAISLIASSMNGRPVNRKPNLVLLGTTSLYGIGSSQYNRIKIPADAAGGAAGNSIEYKELGYSEGFGSFHFSSDTISIADAVVGRENGRSRVNSIFGEGANPLIRKLKDAFQYLNLESNPILNHRNRRVVYGIALAENFGDILLGLAERPKYLIPQKDPQQKTVLLGKYWIKRWLSKRIMNAEILRKVSEHSLSYPINHGARVCMTEDTNPQLSIDL